ncbi:MAG TPA: HAMP domain-containing sensor histidine kinase, partial [Candidatus Dojkabacteria bacterium]|nr:HAMP domain-containing sensor histidine kinase [Candidatus Dojkabacteria bacterium]
DVSNPLMYVMNSLKDKKIDNKNELMDSLEEVTNQLNEVRSHLRIETEQKDFNAFEIVKTTIKILDWKFKKHNIKLKLELDTSINLTHGSSQFKDIVLNLLDNAIDAVKETDNAQIGIKLEKKDKYGILSIMDNGFGIKTKDAKKIFNIFYSTKEQGNGIGLFIANKYAKEEFAGSLSFKSKKNSTTFTFKFLLA